MTSSNVTTIRDDITPKSLDHCVEEGLDAESGEQLFYYNTLEYTVAHPRGDVRARAYLDEITKVALYLPKGAAVDDPDMTRIIAYLARRYDSIQRLTDAGYVDVKTID